RVAGVVAVEAAGIDLDRARAAAAPRAFDRLARGLVHGEEIVAVDLDRGQPEPAGAAGNVAAAAMVRESGTFAVLVVLEHEHGRKLKHHGHVERLESGALV